jgi:hypothetical protein
LIPASLSGGGGGCDHEMRWRQDGQILPDHLAFLSPTMLRHEKHPKGWIDVQLLRCKFTAWIFFMNFGSNRAGPVLIESI